MEELIGRKVRVILNSTQGVVATTGIMLKIENAFLVIAQPIDKIVYFSIYNIKSVELA